MHFNPDSYELQNDAYVKVKINNETYGSTNLMTTVNDLHKWIMSFSKNQIADVRLYKDFDEIARMKH